MIFYNYSEVCMNRKIKYGSRCIFVLKNSNYIVTHLYRLKNLRSRSSMGTFYIMRRLLQSCDGGIMSSVKYNIETCASYWFGNVPYTENLPYAILLSEII